jgi:hypothetical protein
LLSNSQVDHRHSRAVFRVKGRVQLLCGSLEGIAIHARGKDSEQ